MGSEGSSPCGIGIECDYQLVDYADDVNLLGNNRYCKEKNDASKEVGLEINVAKNMLYVTVSSPDKKYHDMKIANRSIQNVAQFKHVERTVRDLIQEEIKRRLNSDNACYHSVQNFCLLICYLKTKIQNLKSESKASPVTGHGSL
jgi:hypothetical protein